MNNPRTLVGPAVLLFSLLLLSGCGRQPAQPYVVTGTLKLPKNIHEQFQNLVANRIPFELVMTARTSPKSGDVIIQRRWKHVSMPFEFGLGKGRADFFRKKTDGVYVTALLTSQSTRFPLRIGGFTAKPVPVGTYHIDLALDADPEQDATYQRPGAPVGGWTSPSIVEEAMPPGTTAKPLGAQVFAGEIVVPQDLNRAFRGWNLRIMARERADRGFPELILPIPSPEFPLSFSLHQNHRMAGGNDPITDPKFVVIVLDRDGMVESTDDQVSVVTEARVPVGTTDLVFKFPEKELRRLLQKNESPASRPASQPAATGAKATPSGMLVAGGTVELDTASAAAAEGATLWLSVRDAGTNASLMFKRESTFSFPYDFTIRNGEGVMGMTVKEGTNIVVKAILTRTGDPLDKQAWVGVSEAATTGASGLKITLKKP